MMLEALGTTQRELLRLLSLNKAGLTSDQLAEALHISRTAVRQHLAALERYGLLELGRSLRTGGRPGQTYVLSDRGRELFPRQYSWFADLLLQALRSEKGAEGLGDLLARLGMTVSAPFAEKLAALSLEKRLPEIARILSELGYDAKVSEGEVVATNCVFHHLAVAQPEVCQFDLSLMGQLSGAEVEHRECIARGGNVCRFGFCRKTWRRSP